MFQLAQAATAVDPGEEIIRKLYHDHQPAKGISVLNTRETLSRYFDKEITDLFIKDQDCSATSGEVCSMDYDPVYNAQEFTESDIKLKIKKQTTTKTEQIYEVSFDNYGPVKLMYHVHKVDDGWRISDIVDSEGHSLKQSLQKPQ